MRWRQIMNLNIEHESKLDIFVMMLVMDDNV